MTDKEIIINGVDVSECVSFDKLNGLNICCYDDTREDKIPFANFCIENKDCSYKQFKRKEQALDEIEKIAKNDIELKYNDKKNTIKRILEIINKAKDGNNNG